MFYDQLFLIQSPEILKEDDLPGLDETFTKFDFDLLDLWGRKTGLIRGNFFETTQVGDVNHFESSISRAFNPEFVGGWSSILYYTGHGLDKENASKLQYPSSPSLGDLKKRFVDDHRGYNRFLTLSDFLTRKCEGRKVKGGELFLHKRGFCDLYGVLKNWPVGSDGYPSVFRNWETHRQIRKPLLKHFIIIVDSCYGGEFAKQLPEFIKDTVQLDPTLFDEINITIQAACGPDERTFGGYFTPVFTYLNDPDNEQLLETLKIEWEGMTEEAKNKYRLLDLPSPMIVTTLPAPQGSTMEIPVMNNYCEDLKVNLFPDAGFFKFCFLKVYRHQDKTLHEGQDRVLDKVLATQFMSRRQFNVIDYKLKIMGGSPGRVSPYAGNPLGLFLLEDPHDEGKVICAHIHFDKKDTSHYSRVNLVHHKRPPLESTSLLHDEDHDNLSKTTIKYYKYKIEVTGDRCTHQLVEACRQFVQEDEMGRWEDVSRWNMTEEDISVRGRFRTAQERSARGDNYLKYIEKFNLPKVSYE